METEKNIKEKIKEIRKETKLSQVAFARKYNIPRRTVEDWEAGRRRCPAYVANMLERCFYNDLFVLPVTGEPLESLRKKANITRKKLSDEYNIPVRTIESWEAEVRPQHCPPYVADMIERCLRSDWIPLYFCVLKMLTGNDSYKDVSGKGWYFIHAGVSYGCTQENMTFEVGFFDKQKCNIEAKKTSKDLTDYYGKGKIDVVVMRGEEVPRYAPDFIEKKS